MRTPTKFVSSASSSTPSSSSCSPNNNNKNNNNSSSNFIFKQRSRRRTSPSSSSSSSSSTAKFAGGVGGGGLPRPRSLFHLSPWRLRQELVVIRIALFIGILFVIIRTVVYYVDPDDNSNGDNINNTDNYNLGDGDRNRNSNSNHIYQPQQSVFLDVFSPTGNGNTNNDKNEKDKNKDKNLIDNALPDYPHIHVSSTGNTGSGKQTEQKQHQSFFLRHKNTGRVRDDGKGNNTLLRRLLIIAAVPRDERHLYTLWTELECFATTTVSTSSTDDVTIDVLLAVPDWSRSIVEPFIEYVRTTIPHFGPHNDNNNSGRQIKIIVQYFINDRYDVGLWCDSIQWLMRNSEQKRTGSESSASSMWSIDDYDQYGLLNDSVFALKQYSGVFDALTERKVSLSSTSYSLTGKKFEGYGLEHFWVESFFRGFDRYGLDVFRAHSCVPADHDAYCRDGTPKRRKECIVDYFEHDLTSRFENLQEQVFAPYLADAPPPPGQPIPQQTWVRNFPKWRALIDDGFPIVKANGPNVIDDPYTHPLLGNCTRYLRQGPDLSSLNLNFTIATMIAELEEMQQMSSSGYGYGYGYGYR